MSGNLGASWVALRPSWDRLGAVLGRLATVLGRSWAVLRPSWGGLGPSLARLGDFWGGLGTPYVPRHRFAILDRASLGGHTPQGLLVNKFTSEHVHVCIHIYIYICIYTEKYYIERDR